MKGREPRIFLISPLEEVSTKGRAKQSGAEKRGGKKKKREERETGASSQGEKTLFLTETGKKKAVCGIKRRSESLREVMKKGKSHVEFRRANPYLGEKKGGKRSALPLPPKRKKAVASERKGESHSPKEGKRKISSAARGKEK